MTESLIGTVSWFPQQYAEVFYLTKGVVALVATVMVVGHMIHTWSDVTTWGRRLRYFALLAFTTLVSFGSTEQLSEDVLVSYRNLGGLVAALLTVAAMVVSIREDVRRRGTGRLP